MLDNFFLKEEHKLIRETAKKFARSKVAPQAQSLDENHRFPEEIVTEMGTLGFMGVAVPEEYGGAGMDALSYYLALEEISVACASTGVIMSVNNSLVCDPVLKFGTDEQKKEFLTQIASGKSLGCYCLSEPEAGSDPVSMKTVAKREKAFYILNGTKNFITNGKEARYAIVFAITDKTKAHKGITAFIVDAKSSGYKVGKLEDKLGIRASSTAQIHFENCKVPISQKLGEEGDGFKVAMTALDSGRIGIAAQAIGIARAAYERALNYSKEREQFGVPISQHQAIQFMLADMATRIDAARLLAVRAAMKKDNREKFSKEASMAKLFASETAMWVTSKAIQVHGGYGYCNEYQVERHYRDAKITEIYEGTSEIQRMVIASLELKS